jgi:hypothetical protein
LFLLGVEVVVLVQRAVSLVVLVEAVERFLPLVALETLLLLLPHKVAMAVLTTVVVVAHLRLALMATVLVAHKQAKVEMELLHL